MLRRDYVLAGVFDSRREQIICVKKDRPAAQKGRINLPGGKVDPTDESHRDALLRELEEECGIKGKHVSGHQYLGCITGTFGDGELYFVHCYRVDLNAPASEFLITPREGETEEFSWKTPNEVVHDLSAMPNLRLIIPLMQNEVYGWTIEDNMTDLGARPYTVQFTTEVP